MKMLAALLAFPLLLTGIQAVAQVRSTTKRPAPGQKATQKTVSKPTPAKRTTPPPVITSRPPASTQPDPLATSATGALFEKGTTIINAGLGLGTGYSFGSGLESTPAVSVSAERGLVEGLGPGTIGVGGMIGYKGYSYQYPNTDRKSRWNTLMLLARGTYHYDLFHHPAVDTYLGVSVGMRIEMHNEKYDGVQLHDPDNPYGGVHLETGVFAGARYFLTKNIGAFGELGYDMTYLKLGLTGRF
ncbi:hypothetical protein HMJ29_04670 [Hymenobacter taeanensis]|uniref:Porin family protein n=1 Tax=Hymenobacter taeanensis TaxID=2735321 RepID=A0A6M6BEA6_9BACT|nr:MULTISPECIES: hypothetical protein [Hymenobacter]QJX46272.1 hypothetical protein HMJ29_04670 [Hymenobacter taeanensis]UOQ80127.1 hypothetical protein MUN83_14950 [Hymenobacter sp. 5414T-23]